MVTLQTRILTCGFLTWMMAGMGFSTARAEPPEQQDRRNILELTIDKDQKVRAGQTLLQLENLRYVDLDDDGYLDVTIASPYFLFDSLNWRQSSIGALLVPVDNEVLRLQLNVPKGQGLVVATVEKGSRASKAGLRLGDVLLTFDGKAILRQKDLLDAFEQAGKAVQLQLIRGGKPVRVVIEPLPVDADARVFTLTARPTTYRIGVSVAPADDTLRTQLGLPKDQGLVITGIVKDSPAMKAGLKQHDVLLSIGKKPLSNFENLSSAINASGGKKVTLQLIHAGKKKSVTVTPEKHANTWIRSLAFTPDGQKLLSAGKDHNIRIWDLKTGKQSGLQYFVAPGVASGPSKGKPASVEERLDQVLNQIQQLQKTVEELKGQIVRPK